MAELAEHALKLTHDEQESLLLSGSKHTYKVRLVYFLTKRCEGCTERRSCTMHEDMMLNIAALDQDQLLSMFQN